MRRRGGRRSRNTDNRMRESIRAGDDVEALNAARAIGEDRLRQSSGGRVAPESFRHATSDKRRRWLVVHFERGDTDGCTTFAADRP